MFSKVEMATWIFVESVNNITWRYTSVAIIDSKTSIRAWLGDKTWLNALLIRSLAADSPNLGFLLVSYFFANVILCADYERHINLLLTSAYAFLSIQNRDCFYVNAIAATRDIKTSTTPRKIDSKLPSVGLLSTSSVVYIVVNSLFIAPCNLKKKIHSLTHITSQKH